MMMTSGSGVNYKSMFDAGSQIIGKEGVKSLFKGAGANILRGVAGAGVLSLYDKFQEIMFGKVYSGGEFPRLFDLPHVFNLFILQDLDKKDCILVIPVDLFTLPHRPFFPLLTCVGYGFGRLYPGRQISVDLKNLICLPLPASAFLIR
jgi:hypothetical protein